MLSKTGALASIAAVLATLGSARAQQQSSVNPIIIQGKHFVDSVTGERFLMRGVDYQPGGSAAYDKRSDPLSNADVCARDIYLMQELGINTVRVYTINPKLNHDDCMTMLAAANIYLVLDVNSPLVAESLNRYEPWTTYTPEYLRHIFEVVDQFSRYNNTLGFFIGNEIVNDERSAAVSPPYIRAVARDVKDYMYTNCPRRVPIGYSAADDLRYRTQLPQYLTCGDPSSSVDFYGVNSYQWCGKQTLQSSGYDVLLRDHQDMDFPIFFSEFGCNHIQPRVFQEVSAIFSPEMIAVFQGGLVYEFTQEPNDYGLVSIDSSGNAHLREDFFTLRDQYRKVMNQTASSNTTEATSFRPSGPTGYPCGLSTSGYTALGSDGTPTPTHGIYFSSTSPLDAATHECVSTFANLSGAAKPIPDSFGTDMIRNGVHIKRGKYNPDVLMEMPASRFRVFDLVGRELPDTRVRVVNHFDALAQYAWVQREGAGPVDGENGRIEEVGKSVKKAANKNGARRVAVAPWASLLQWLVYFV